uniref:Uncharacterized protein n=1 Tax=Anguilla anguilla TaxID=7936 RepID=A0A0E9SVT7_ANGAN
MAPSTESAVTTSSVATTDDLVFPETSPAKFASPPGPMMNCGAACTVTVSGLSGFVFIWFCMDT